MGLKIFNDDQLKEFRDGNTEEKFLIFTTPSCHKCHAIVKQLEANDNEYNFAMYLFRKPDSFGGELIQELGFSSVPILLHKRSKNEMSADFVDTYPEAIEWIKKELENV